MKLTCDSTKIDFPGIPFLLKRDMAVTPVGQAGKRERIGDHTVFLPDYSEFCWKGLFGCKTIAAGTKVSWVRPATVDGILGWRWRAVVNVEMPSGPITGILPDEVWSEDNPKEQVDANDV